MDNLPDDILECICEKLLNGEIGTRDFRNQSFVNRNKLYPMKPTNVYQLRGLSTSFRRVIDKYKHGFNTTYKFNYVHKYINTCEYLSRPIKFDINGLVWCAKNGFIPNEKCLNRLITYKNVDNLFISIDKNTLRGMGDIVTRSNNIACIDWYITNKIDFKKDMIFNIKKFDCMHVVINKYYELMYTIDVDRFIGHICSMLYTPSCIKLILTSQIFEDLIPVYNDKQFNKHSYNSLVKNTCEGTQKHYILHNIQKYIATDFNLDDLCRHLCVVAQYCKEWSTVKLCFDIVAESINSNYWIYNVVKNIINSNIKLKNNSHLWQYIRNIILFYNYPEDTLKLPVIYRTLVSRVSNNDVKSMIDCGFQWGYSEVEQAARNRNKELMKILAERMI